MKNKDDKKVKIINKVELVSNGFLTLCRAYYITGDNEVFNWSSEKDRKLVKSLATDDVEVIAGPNVKKGWDYN